MAISTHCIYIDRQDTNLKNSRFTEANKHNEEYLGVLDINISSIVVKLSGQFFFFTKDILTTNHTSKTT